jgi:glycosyltransferase involved in cell wall biosynthesis
MTRLKRVFQSLRDLGVDVEVLSPYTNPTGKPRILKGIIRYLVLMTQIALTKADIYHFFNVPDIIGMPLVLKKGKLVYDVRSPWFSSVLETLRIGPLSRLAGIVERVLTKQADIVLTANTPLAKRAMRWGAKKVLVVPNYPPVDFLPTQSRNTTRKQLGLSDNFVVLYLGKISTIEGSELLKSIIDHCSSANRIKFLIVGDGPQKESVVRYLRTRGLLENVILVGWVPHNQVPNYIEAADLCLLPRTWSSFSQYTSPENILKTGEYLALGKPVITPKMGGFASAQFPIIVVEPEEMGQAILDFASNPRVVQDEDRPSWTISHKRLEAVYKFLKATPLDNENKS